MKNIYWPKRMRDYLGIRQLYDDKNRFQNMLNEFSKEAFGSDKVLEFGVDRFGTCMPLTGIDHR